MTLTARPSTLNAAPRPGISDAGSPAVSAVVPVYNGASTLPELVERLIAVLKRTADEHEIVLVNDGSEDDSWQAISALAAEHPDVRGLDLERNYGQHNALLAGIRTAKGGVIVTLDDDLQNPPEEVPKLLDRLRQNGADVVYGTPIRKRHGRFRNLAARLVVKGLNKLGGSSAPMVSAFRAFNTELRRSFADYNGPDVSVDGLLTWGTSRFDTVPVEHHERVGGKSSYNLRSLIAHALTMITAFSTQPLRIATMVGFAATTFGLGVLCYVLIRYFAAGDSLPGFPFLASLISILAGTQLFTIGVIGEYLARMHVRMMNRPSYLVRTELGSPDGR